MRMAQGAWTVAALAALWLVAGCDPATPGTGAPTAAASVAADDGAVAVAASEAPGVDATGTAGDGPALVSADASQGRDVDVSNDLYEFEYAYPDAAGAVPAVKAQLDASLDEEQADLAADSRKDRASAKAGGYPYHPHAYAATWKVVTDLPGWLSLSAEIYTFSGGAHGMSNFDTMLWDRRGEALHVPVELFTSEAAISGALRDRFCKALDKQRVARRGAPLEPGGMFSDCIDPLDQTMILGSSNGKTFDRIGLLVAPYEAGPYAEGSYEVTLPVDAAVMKALKPQYRSSFSIPG